jgi:hypothetical protein
VIITVLLETEQRCEQKCDEQIRMILKHILLCALFSSWIEFVILVKAKKIIYTKIKKLVIKSHVTSDM